MSYLSKYLSKLRSIQSTDPTGKPSSILSLQTSSIHTYPKSVPPNQPTRPSNLAFRLSKPAAYHTYLTLQTSSIHTYPKSVPPNQPTRPSNLAFRLSKPAAYDTYPYFPFSSCQIPIKQRQSNPPKPPASKVADNCSSKLGNPFDR